MHPFLLSHQDSNLNRQNQNLQCYRYTMRQAYLFTKAVQKYSFLPIIQRKSVLFFF